MEIFNNYITEGDWSAVCSSENVNFAYSTFIDKIQYAYVKAFPLKQVSKERSRDKLWITPALRRSCHKKIHCIEDG